MSSMTDKATLLSLAERVEGLIAPDRVVDAEIARALNVPPLYKLPGHIGATWPNYTASLDAAMTLVPEGCWLELKGPRRYLNIPTNSPNFWSAYLSSYNHEGDVMGWAATPALALCAAALRARAEILP